MLVPPSPNVHDHAVGTLVDRSENCITPVQLVVVFAAK